MSAECFRASASTLDETGRQIGTGFADSMRRATFAGFVGVEIVLGIVSAVDDPDVSRLLVVLVTAVAVAAGLIVLLRGAPSILLVGTFYALIAFFYIIASTPDGPLISVLIPFTSWTVAMPVMLRPGARAAVAAALLSAGVGVVIVLAHPSWGGLLLASIVTNLTTTCGAVVMMTILRRTAESIDRLDEAEVREELRAVRARALNERTTEYIRMLHDTVINTFGALARETAYGMTAADVRERCRDDVERIRTFQNDGERPRRPDPTTWHARGFPVHWVGDSRTRLRRCAESLPDDLLNALHGCMSESILNAAKHSGSDHVVCDAQAVDGRLHVTIRDDGRGFERSAVVERGIAASLFARARAAGIDAHLETSPGRGTTVQLVTPLDQRTESTSSGRSDEHASTKDFTLRFGVAWATLALGIGIALMIARGSIYAVPAGALFALLLSMVGLTWMLCRGGRRAPILLTVILLAAVPVVNWFALHGIDYGTTAPYLFPAIALTALPVLLYGATLEIRLFIVAAAVQVLSVPVIAWIGGGADLQVSLGALILEGPVLTQLAALYILLTVFAAIVRRQDETERRLIRARRISARQEAEAEVRMQWSASSLQQPFHLLQALAEGVVSPTDPHTRRRCAEEEAYLRQISELPPDAASLTSWLARALAEARQRSVMVQLNVESARIENPRHAEALGRLLLSCITRSPRRAELTASILHDGAGPHLLIVGDGRGLADHAWADASGILTISCEELPGQTLIEARIAA